ncbi:MAG: hypothetical protein ACE5LD_03360 [Candidatus Bipolaricaulia bacterium]
MDGLISLLITSSLLGLLHGIEPDHAAGITALASGAGPKKSFLIGVFFALGHVILVIGWLIILSLGMRALPEEVMAAVGERIIGIVLALLGTIMILQAIHSHAHRHHEAEHQHLHLHLLGRGHGHKHGVMALFKISLVGSVFALSPPLSMMAFLSAVVLSQGLKLVLVLPYALAILLSMGLVGAGVGTLFHHLQRDRAFPVLRASAGVLIIGYGMALFL